MKRSLYIFIFTIGTTLFFFFLSITTDHPRELISPLAEAAMAISKKIENTALSEKVDEALVGTTGTYSIVIKNLKTKESYMRDEDRTFEAASLYKLWIMAEVFRQVEAGQLSLDVVLSSDIATLNRKFNLDAPELTEGSISMSVQEALTQMITISHNYAALLLSEKIKLSAAKIFLTEQGLSGSSLGEPPQTTASDIALFFEKLYTGKLANEENTQKMLSLLKKQTINGKLPKYLPANTVIAHKTGELGYFTHDAGIVFMPHGDYIIVVLSESTMPPAAEDRIADISKAVFEYFQTKE